MIFHITPASQWEAAVKKGYFEVASLHSEGFIHMSYDNQVPGVLKRYYKDQTDLVLLHVDENKVIAEIKYELAPSVNEIFPHIYGTINLDAIINVTKIN